jgi:hypothetical protein
VKIAWDKRDGYTFGDAERELLENADARASIKLAMKLLDKSRPPTPARVATPMLPTR